MPSNSRHSIPFLFLVCLCRLFVAIGQFVSIDELNRIPPNIYRWIEENAHICTIVPTNGESLVNFLSVEEGTKCVLCPELKPRDLPAMACAVEVSPNDIDINIGCHPSTHFPLFLVQNRCQPF